MTSPKRSSQDERGTSSSIASVQLYIVVTIWNVLIALLVALSLDSHRLTRKARTSRAEEETLSEAADIPRDTPSTAHSVFVVEDPSKSSKAPTRSRRSSKLFRKGNTVPIPVEKEKNASEKRGRKHANHGRCMRCGKAPCSRL